MLRSLWHKLSLEAQPAEQFIGRTDTLPFWKLSMLFAEVKKLKILLQKKRPREEDIEILRKRRRTNADKWESCGVVTSINFFKLVCY